MDGVPLVADHPPAAGAHAPVAAGQGLGASGLFSESGQYGDPGPEADSLVREPIHNYNVHVIEEFDETEPAKVGDLDYWKTRSVHLRCSPGR